MNHPAVWSEIDEAADLLVAAIERRDLQDALRCVVPVFNLLKSLAGLEKPRKRKRRDGKVRIRGRLASGQKVDIVVEPGQVEEVGDD